MTSNDDVGLRSDPLGGRLAGWMTTTAPSHEPATLVPAAMARTRSIRQRPAFLVRTGFAGPGRAMRPPVLAWVAILAILALAVAGVLAVAGSRPRPVPMPAEPPPIVSPATAPTAGPAVLARERLETAGSTTVGAIGAFAAPLPGGRVLIVGEEAAERFDPATGATVAAGPGYVPMSAIRIAPLPDGRIVIVGWRYGAEANTGQGAVQIYDPTPGTFADVGPMTMPRLEPAVVTLADGRVLITGGAFDESGVPDRTAEIYDPAAGTFTRTGSMLRRRMAHSMTLLADGRVLVIGGDQGDDVADIYDPATGTFTPAGPRVAAQRFRGRTTARVAPVRLPDGKVLVFGVQAAQHCGLHGIEPIAAELFDPMTETFAAAPPIAHDIATATASADGKVVMTGRWQAIPGGCAGGGDYVFDAWIGIYDPATGMMRQSRDPISGVSTLPVDTDQGYATSVILGDGRVLLVGTGTQPGGSDPPYDLDILG